MRIILTDGTVLEEAVNRIEMDTKLGVLYAQPNDVRDYPGFYVILKRPDGNEFAPMLVEVDQDDFLADSEPVVPLMKLHYWSPTDYWADPAWDKTLTAEEIDSAFREEE